MFTASLPWEFQSTLPVRGATVRCWIWTRTGKISIHAPREGSDHAGDRKSIQLHRFQSTLPVRGATSIGVYVDHLSLFQSTLPVRGATADGIVITDSAAEFQSTLPVRGATCGFSSPLCRSKFQSTLPVRGATPEICRAIVSSPRFQSTLPVRGATGGVLETAPVRPISIHAPREGSDWMEGRPNYEAGNFNPRSP